MSTPAIQIYPKKSAVFNKILDHLIKKGALPPPPSFYPQHGPRQLQDRIAQGFKLRQTAQQKKEGGLNQVGGPGGQ